MKAFLLVIVFAWSFGSVQMMAQATNTVPPAQKRMLSFLTPEEQSKVESVHQKVLANHPELKTEEDDLKVKAAAAFSQDSTPEDKQAFRATMKTHFEKMRAEMLKEDPSVGPIFQKIDAHRAEHKEAGGTSK